MFINGNGQFCTKETRGQRPNESQKAVIIDMMSSLVLYPFWGKFDLNLWPWPLVKVIGTWVIECALLGCTLVPIMKCVGEIASKIWPVLCFFFTHLLENLTLTFDLDQGHRHLGHWMRLIGLYLEIGRASCRERV